MNLKVEEVKGYIQKWQDILRLRDWDILLQIVTVEWRKSADIKIDADDKKAILMLNSCNRKQTNIEEVIIHELIHLKLWGMDQMLESLLYSVFGQDENDPKFLFAYTQFMQVLETTVEDLAKGYLQTGGENQEISFGRLMPQVEKELAKIKS